MRAFGLLASSEGIIPAIESAHALAGAIEVGTELGPDGLILVNLSGRGDKDMDTATRYFEQAAPSTTDERLRELAAAGTGFIYASSLLGVTGTRDSVSAAASSLVQRIRAAAQLPVCVGIGISSAAQAAEVAGFAHGVIVASVLVKAVLNAPDAVAGAATVAELTAELSLATRRNAD